MYRHEQWKWAPYMEACPSVTLCNRLSESSFPSSISLSDFSTKILYAAWNNLFRTCYMPDYLILVGLFIVIVFGDEYKRRSPHYATVTGRLLLCHSFSTLKVVWVIPKRGCLLCASILRIAQMVWVWRATLEWYWQGKTEELREKPVPVLYHS
jgi:hypothetical protein